MNERLRELADQAGFIRFSPEEDPRTPIDWSSDYEHELKRFAELIVLESANFLKDVLDDHFAAEQLAEHFGVEQ